MGAELILGICAFAGLTGLGVFLGAKYNGTSFFVEGNDNSDIERTFNEEEDMKWYFDIAYRNTPGNIYYDD